MSEHVSETIKPSANPDGFIMLVSSNDYLEDTLTIFTSISPTGNGIITVSPVLRPISAAAIGDSIQILPVNGSASADPRIL